MKDGLGLAVAAIFPRFCFVPAGGQVTVLLLQHPGIRPSSKVLGRKR
jgi:hypothetical protein